MDNIRQDEMRKGREYVGMFGSWFHFLSLMALMMRR